MLFFTKTVNNNVLFFAKRGAHIKAVSRGIPLATALQNASRQRSHAGA
jgi:hypothetical protein